MSGRTTRGGGRGGRGGGRGRNHGRGSNYTGATNATKKGLCASLGSNIFDYGGKGAADQLRTSWEKLTQYVGTTFGQDIRNELENKVNITIPEPTHTAAVLARHNAREIVVRTGQANLQAARRVQEAILQATVDAGTDANAPMQLQYCRMRLLKPILTCSSQCPSK